MKKKPYLPRTDAARLAWLLNFSSKLGAYQAGPGLGLTAGDVTAASNMHLMWSYMLGFGTLIETRGQQVAAYTKALRSGPDEAIGDPPEAAAPNSPPTTVDGGLFRRIGKMVKTIKAHANYTEAIGEDLGIVGDESDFDPQDGKPEIELRLVSGNMVEIRWKKGDYDALRIEVDRGTGWEFLAIDTRPHYTDNHPGPIPGASALCKYRAIYLLADEMVGMWSDTAEIAIPGA